MSGASGRRTPRDDGRLDPAGTFGLVVLLCIVVASVVAFWPAKPSAPTKIAAKGAGPKGALERKLAASGESVTLHLRDTSGGRGDAPVLSITLETIAPPTTFWSGAPAPREPDRVGCRVVRFAAPSSDADGGVRVDVPAAVDDSEPNGDVGWSLARTACSFRRLPDGAIHAVVFLAPDEITGVADGDGLVVPGSTWPAEARAALRLASVAFPAETLGVGAQWTFDEDTVLDHFQVHRHVAYELTAWTEHGASVVVDVDEVAPEQDYDPSAAAGRALAVMVKEKTGMPAPATMPLEGLLPVNHLKHARLHAHGVLTVLRDATFPEGELVVHTSHAVEIRPPRGEEAVAKRPPEVRTGEHDHVFRYTRTPDPPR